MHVAELYGLKGDGELRTLTIGISAAALMAQLDGEVAEIMDKWMR